MSKANYTTEKIDVCDGINPSSIVKLLREGNRLRRSWWPPCEYIKLANQKRYHKQYIEDRRKSVYWLTYDDLISVDWEILVLKSDNEKEK